MKPVSTISRAPLIANPFVPFYADGSDSERLEVRCDGQRSLTASDNDNIGVRVEEISREGALSGPGELHG
jgi:hypothetical protein